jgi:hypothetical protein
MIILIKSPDYLRQFILHSSKDIRQAKDCIDTNTGNPLSYFLLIHFRQPKGAEVMPELHDGLKIRVSSKLKLEKKIYLSPTAQGVFLKLAQSMFKKEFRTYMADLLHNDAFVVGAIKDFLESRGIEYDNRVYEMLSKDFYRWRKKLTA